MVAIGGPRIGNLILHVRFDWTPTKWSGRSTLAIRMAHRYCTPDPSPAGESAGFRDDA
jgi:hypothetical protein